MLNVDIYNTLSSCASLVIPTWVCNHLEIRYLQWLLSWVSVLFQKLALEIWQIFRRLQTSDGGIMPFTMEINRNLLSVQARGNTGLLWTTTSRTQQGNSSSLQLYMTAETSEIGERIRNHLKSSKLQQSYLRPTDSCNTLSMMVICAEHLCHGSQSCTWIE